MGTGGGEGGGRGGRVGVFDEALEGVQDEVGGSSDLGGVDREGRDGGCLIVLGPGTGASSTFTEREGGGLRCRSGGLWPRCAAGREGPSRGTAERAALGDGGRGVGVGERSLWASCSSTMGGCSEGSRESGERYKHRRQHFSLEGAIAPAGPDPDPVCGVSRDHVPSSDSLTSFPPRPIPRDPFPRSRHYPRLLFLHKIYTNLAESGAVRYCCLQEVGHTSATRATIDAASDVCQAAGSLNRASHVCHVGACRSGGPGRRLGQQCHTSSAVRPCCFWATPP